MEPKTLEITADHASQAAQQAFMEAQQMNLQLRAAVIVLQEQLEQKQAEVDELKATREKGD